MSNSFTTPSSLPSPQAAAHLQLQLIKNWRYYTNYIKYLLNSAASNQSLQYVLTLDGVCMFFLPFLHHAVHQYTGNTLKPQDYSQGPAEPTNNTFVGLAGPSDASGTTISI